MKNYVRQRRKKKKDTLDKGENNFWDVVGKEEKEFWAVVDERCLLCGNHLKRNAFGIGGCSYVKCKGFVC